MPQARLRARAASPPESSCRTRRVALPSHPTRPAVLVCNLPAISQVIMVVSYTVVAELSARMRSLQHRVVAHGVANRSGGGVAARSHAAAKSPVKGAKAAKTANTKGARRMLPKSLTRRLDDFITASSSASSAASDEPASSAADVEEGLRLPADTDTGGDGAVTLAPALRSVASGRWQAMRLAASGKDPRIIGDLSRDEMAGADDELHDDPNAAPTDPIRRMTIAGSPMPPVLFEGWCYKKKASGAATRLTAAFAAMPSLNSRYGWARRYVRVFPGRRLLHPTPTPAPATRPRCLPPWPDSTWHGPIPPAAASLR